MIIAWCFWFRQNSVIFKTQRSHITTTITNVQLLRMALEKAHLHFHYEMNHFLISIFRASLRSRYKSERSNSREFIHNRKQTDLQSRSLLCSSLSNDRLMLYAPISGGFKIPPGDHDTSLHRCQPRRWR